MQFLTYPQSDSVSFGTDLFGFGYRDIEEQRMIFNFPVWDLSNSYIIMQS